MANSQAIFTESPSSGRSHIVPPGLGNAFRPHEAKVVASQGGRIVVQHEDGYLFVFQVHDIDDRHMDLEEVTWSPIGAPPDADELEQKARSVAEAEARERGWLD